jgi:hypothetical protein
MLIVPASIGLFGDGFPSDSATASVIKSALVLDGATDYLQLSFSGEGSNTKGTISFWVRRNKTGEAHQLFHSRSSSGSSQLVFDSSDKIYWRLEDTGGNQVGQLTTTQVFRDVTAWQHIVVNFDTGNSTADNRMRVYVNGSEVTSFATRANPSQGAVSTISDAVAHYIGATHSPGDYADVSLAEYVYIDGIQLAASVFGTNDSNGVWGPKDLSSTENIADWGGSNSFWLKFDDGNNIGKNSRPTTVTTVDGTYKIDNSLWLDGGADYLVRDPSSSGNRKTFTFSCWLKRSAIGSQGGTTGNNIFGGDRASGSGHSDRIMFGTADDGNDYLEASFHDGSSGTCKTSALYRDPTAWMHVLWVVDTTQAAASNRVKIYVNGVEAALNSPTYPAQNYDTNINYTENQAIGVRAGTLTQQHFGGYLANVILLDGTAVTDASDFGGWDSNGDWLPVDPTTVVTNNKGTNGFHLDFALAQGSGNGPGNDISGNNNDFTNVSLTAAQTTTDSPTNTAGDNEGNYPVWNLAHSSIDHSTSVIDSVTEGGLRATVTSNNSSTIFSTMASPASGKYMIRFVNKDASNNSNILVGLQDTSQALPAYNSSAGIASSGQRGVVYRFSGGYLYINGTNSHQYTTGASADNTLDLAWDADTGKVWIAVNGTWQDGEGNTGGGSTDIDGAGTGNVATLTSGYQYAIACSMWDTTSVFIDQDGGTLPTDFKRFNTANFPAPTVTDPRAHYANALYTGTAQSKTVRSCFDSTGTAWTPDFVWIKCRSDAGEHVLVDSVRGAANVLTPDAAAAEFVDVKAVTSLIEGGFTLGNGDDRNDSNDSAKTYVAWCMKAGGAPTVENDNTSSAMDDGSVFKGGVVQTSYTPSGSPSTYPKKMSIASHGGFSIVKYVGTGSNATVPHGLSRTPGFFVTKPINQAHSWSSYHKAFGADDDVIYWDTDAAKADQSGGAWQNNPLATDHVITLGTQTGVNQNTVPHIMYTWARTPGMIGIGSYAANADADGTTVVIDDGASGFRPAWLMVKNADAGSRYWVMLDSARNTFNPVQNALITNETLAEDTGYLVDFTANGFKLRVGDSTQLNTGTNTHIYLAFADQPFNLARAR